MIESWSRSLEEIKQINIHLSIDSYKSKSPNAIQVETKTKEEYNTLIFSLVMVVALMLCGLVFNELTSSNIIELDAGAYVISAIIGSATIYISKLKDKPKDETHPFGYAGFVPILNLIRSFMIIVICFQGIIGAVSDIYRGPQMTNHSMLFFYAVITFVVNVISFSITWKTGKRIHSALLMTDALEWRIDTILNISILGAIAISFGLQFSSYHIYSDYIDPVFTIFLSVFMSYSPIRLFSENLKLLSISTVDMELKTTIENAFHLHDPKLQEFHPKFVVLHMGGVLWVELELKTKDVNLNMEEYDRVRHNGELILANVTEDYRLSIRLIRS